MKVMVSAIIPVVPSRDVAESLRFYQAYLGFTEPFSWGENPVEYGGLGQDGLRLHFYHEPNTQIGQNYAVRRQVDEA
ncbi:hypothetical protein HKBW3S33_02243, partial [Candidatus Hakubella thermalkaliphila]